ncbi:MAG: PAS domain S-box protein [Proteobacteria bacterium]|nr:PAS domain S-box protein [Pseudomonadota bacterium]MBU2470045.1 PAS domain S-box protein [Pseudomonadota bacterium]MBU2518433.1 PAS domain S-box protein [Pseudomonadota bacterium]
MFFTTLLYNAALLLALGYLYSLIARHWDKHNLAGQVYKGLLFGGVVLGVMANPVTFMPGIVFDTRSVVVSIAGMFGGPVTGAIAVVFASAFRAWTGGSGAFTGVLVVFVSGLLGVAYYYWKKGPRQAMRPAPLYGFGLLVHIAMLLCMLTLPWPAALLVLKKISLPVLLIYPVVTMLLALMLAEGESNLEAEKALEASESRFRLSFENANIGMVLTGLDGRLLRINDQFRGMLGYGSEELVGKYFNDISHPDDHQAGLGFVSQALAGGKESAQLEKRYLHKSGKPVWCNVSATLLKDPKGAPSHFITTAQDITERKRAQQALQQSEEKFSLAFLTAPYAIAITRAEDGAFVDVNDAFTSLSGFTRQETLAGSSIGLDLWVDEEDRQRVVADLGAGRAVVGREYQFRTKSGDIITGLFSAQPILLSNGPCIMSSINDITERKRAEEEKERLESQLRQAQKMEAVGILAGGIAHDFNNILGAIMGYVELAQNLALEGRSNVAELAQVLQSVYRARNLVRQMMTFSRKTEADLMPLGLNKAVRQITQMLEHSLPKMIAIETRLASDLELVNADSTQMEQVLLNLATNAADAMPEGGRLVIETQNIILGEQYSQQHLDVGPGRYVLLMVSDTGHGIEPQTMEHIFDPFFTTKEVGKGTGLGLSTVYGITKGHGGHVYCYSEPGMGTTFKVYLPAYQAGAAASALEETLPEQILGGTETILLVDDELVLRDLGARALESMGYRVLTKANGEEALETYRSQGDEIDLVVMDIGMPGMGGHKCLLEILAINPKAKVVIASGYSANGQVKASLESGAAGFVAKPFRRLDLLATVRSALDKK